MKTVNLTEEEHAAILKLRAKNKATASTPETRDVVRAAGTSEGAKKGWESREGLSSIAGISDSSNVKIGEGQKSKSGSESFFIKHRLGGEVSADQVKEIHRRVADHLESSGFSKKSQTNGALHGAGSAGHSNEIYENKTHQVHLGGTGFSNRDWNGYIHIQPKAASKAKASDMNEELEIIHCRSHASAAGSVLAADAAWTPGESVEFMWMPSGRHTICAGFRNGSIELTVNCDENTAANVQASLDAWRTERPKQEPFGCIEHREHEASVRVSAQQAFTFKDDGVYIAAEPTMLGAQNVNGKVHRSWSPSFTTDADYSAAKTVKTASGATVMVFPEGVRGSRSNPAEITGVDFCVGTLTNKPAFHAMSPVKSSEGEAVTASGNSEGAKKGWEDRHVSLSFESAADGVAKKIPNNKSDEALAGHKVASELFGKARDASHPKYQASLHRMHVYHKEMADKETSHPEALKKAYEAEVDHPNYKVAKASDTTNPEVIHCRTTLLQDVPNATAAEIACYDKCIDEGGSHITAVTEIKAKRDPAYVTQKASDELTPNSIYAALEQRTAAANEVATEAGVISVEDVYAKVTATGTSEGSKKGWEVRMHSDQSGRGTFTTLHLEHAESRDDAYAQAAKKGKGTAFPWVGSAKMKKDAAKASDATPSASIHATWSDAAREASAEAKRGHTLDGDSIHEGMDVRPRHQYGGKPGRVTGWDSDKSFIKVKHEDGTSASYHHSDLHTHYGDEDDPNTRASESALTLESIYARAGANR